MTDYTDLLEPIKKLFPSTEAIQASPNPESDASRFVRVGSLFYLGIRRRNPDFPCPEPDAKPVKQFLANLRMLRARAQINFFRIIIQIEKLGTKAVTSAMAFDVPAVLDSSERQNVAAIVQARRSSSKGNERPIDDRAVANISTGIRSMWREYPKKDQTAADRAGLDLSSPSRSGNSIKQCKLRSRTGRSMASLFE